MNTPTKQGWGKLPKEVIRDSEVVEKARAMCAYCSDQRISDYLGMALAQVETIRRNIATPADHRMSPHWPFPVGFEADWERKRDARDGSAKLLDALRRVA